MCVFAFDHMQSVFFVKKVMHPSLFTSNTRNASEASTLIKRFDKKKHYNPIVAFVCLYFKTSLLILRCNGVNVMALLCI